MSEKTRRILMSLTGVLLCAVSVGMFKRAAMGVDPFQALMGGLNAAIPIPFGALYAAANALLLLFALRFDRHRIGIATFLNLFLLGYAAQFSLDLLCRWLPELTVAGRLALLAAAVAVSCFSAALYFTADLGVSTYDAVALVMAHKWRLAPFKHCRVACDLTCVAAGAGLFLLSGGSWAALPELVGVGTLITAFFMGPLIEVFTVKAARPLLYGRRRVSGGVSRCT